MRCAKIRNPRQRSTGRFVRRQGASQKAIRHPENHPHPTRTISPFDYKLVSDENDFPAWVSLGQQQRLRFPTQDSRKQRANLPDFRNTFQSEKVMMTCVYAGLPSYQPAHPMIEKPAEKKPAVAEEKPAANEEEEKPAANEEEE